MCDRYNIPLPIVFDEILQWDRTVEGKTDEDNGTDRETDKKQDKSTS